MLAVKAGTVCDSRGNPGNRAAYLGNTTFGVVHMPYIDRNEEGRISALTMSGDASREFLPVEHPEVLQFLAGPAEEGESGTSGVEMLFSDLKLIRVIEDVIDLLIAKRVIIFSELPLPVQQKILQKKGKREALFGGGVDILGSEKGIL